MTKFLSRFALIAAFFVAGSHDVVAQAQYGEGTWTVAARAGIAPAVFSKKGEFTGTFVATTGLKKSTGVSFKHSDLYKLPFTAGLDLGYFVCDNWEVFGNFNYTHACHKDFNLTAKVDTSDANAAIDNDAGLFWTARDLSVMSFNMGSRYYICDWSSDCFLPFVGAKLGIAVRSSSKGKERLSYTDEDGTVLATRANRKNQAAFTGAFQMGFDYMLDQNYALTFMSELVGKTGAQFRSHQQLHFTDSDGSFFSSISKNPKGTLSFPITLGFRVAL